jgi:uncharacterized protein
MPEITTIVGALLIGFIGSFLGSIIGAGGLVSIPLLIFTGLPPQVAIATNKFMSVGLGVGAIPKFWKAEKVLWKYVPIFIVISILAAYVGANLLLRINEAILGKVVGIIILLVLPIVFIKKDFGIIKREVSNTRKAVGHFFYFLGLVYAAFFGAGAGTIIFVILMYFFGFTIIEANATDLIAWYLLTIISLVIFAINGIVNYAVGIPLLIGGVIGGYIGAHTAIKKGNRWVRALFVPVIIFSGLKLLFF